MCVLCAKDLLIIGKNLTDISIMGVEECDKPGIRSLNLLNTDWTRFGSLGKTGNTAYQVTL